MWRIFEGADEAWDKHILQFPEATIFQSSAWARHKADFGWRPVRAVAENFAAIQALCKNAPGGARILWSRGGPLGDAQNFGGAAAALWQGAGGLARYARLASYRIVNEPDASAFRQSGWTQSERPLNKAQTFFLDLSADEETLRKNLSANWRHNLKRAETRAAISPWENPDASEMESLYLSLEQLKSLPAQHRADSLSSLVRRLGDALILRRAVVDGRVVALRACAVFGARAVDLLAAAGPEARKIYASYGLLWSILVEARRRGATNYDLGGADFDSARGVADFKSGTGGVLARTLGEWDCASPRPLRRAAGALLAMKMAGAA